MGGIKGCRCKNTRSHHPYVRVSGRGGHEQRGVGQPENVEAEVAAPDRIHPAIAKSLAGAPVKRFTECLIASLDERRLTAEWLTSTDVGVLKGGNRDNCGSNRLEIRTSILLKTLGRAFRDGMVNDLEANELMVVDNTVFVTNFLF